MQTFTKKRPTGRRVSLLVSCAVALLLGACNIIVSFNSVGKIKFQAGVHDSSWKLLSTVTDKMFFMGGWGKRSTPEPWQSLVEWCRSRRFRWWRLRIDTIEC